MVDRKHSAPNVPSARRMGSFSGSSWTVFYVLHIEATAYLASLRARDCSPNTERAYAGRIALYLAYCAETGLDWASPTVWQLGAFLRWLVEDPLPPRGHQPTVEPRFRSKGTANHIVTTVCEFLRFGCTHRWVRPEVVAPLSAKKFLDFLPSGFDPGEDGQFRTVRTKLVKFRVAIPGYEWLTPDQIDALIQAAPRARDRFLVSLLRCTGMRIGEALGLRREDMHLLASSKELGCPLEGPHVHVRRRRNANGAWAKSRKPRSIPVTADVIDSYIDYQLERDLVPAAADCDLVLVNMFHAPLGEGMKYGTVKEMFDRLAVRAGITARPHMLRHSAATELLRAGTDRSVVQEILGHVSARSMDVYTHVDDKDKRAAFDAVAAAQKKGNQ
ncbi:site-specific recombinase XerD [Nocardia ignorata]|uniref:Site-specific recombinase XerD n=2 Tax=Nocardia ignorata TaxID=145285 RepID=A0A4R6P285_NOCIG|nr:site-specific recombinase XerD [Nocardia ignorata]